MIRFQDAERIVAEFLLAKLDELQADELNPREREKMDRAVGLYRGRMNKFIATIEAREEEGVSES